MSIKPSALSKGFIIGVSGMLITILSANLDTFSYKISLQIIGAIIAIIGAVVLIKGNKQK